MGPAPFVMVTALPALEKRALVEFTRMRYLVIVLLLVQIGCGGSSSPGIGGQSSGSGSGSAAPTASGKGLAVSVSVKQLPNKVVRRGEEIQQVVLAVVDPATLQSVIPVTIVRRDPSQASQSVRLEVPPGRWLLRVQGRSSDGQAAGTRFEEMVPVTAEQVTTVLAELNPLTDLTGLQLSPAPQFQLAPGTTRQLTVTGIRSDLTSENVTNNVLYTSSAPGVATVSATGLVNATGLGTATLTARTGNLTATTTVQVTQVTLTELQLTPTALTLTAGMSRQLTATGIFSDNSNQDLTGQVTWSSSDPARASVSATGLVTGAGVGSATITARQGQVSATATVSVQATLSRLEVTPGTLNLPVGKSQSLKATGFFNDGTTQDLTAAVSWSSSAPGAASVDSTGQVLARSPGAADVTATSGNVTAGARVTVLPAELTGLTVTPAGARLPKGTSRAFRATGTFSDGSSRDLTETATWTSTNSTILVVSNAGGTRGQATGANVGTAFVEASQDALTGAVAVNVTAAELVALDLRPVNPVLTQAFQTLQFQVLGRFTDGTEVDLTNLATWTSSKPTVASISNAAGTQGLATALASGITAIQVASGNVTNATALRVEIPGPPPPASPTPLGRLFGPDQIGNSVPSWAASIASGPAPYAANISGPATTLNTPTTASVDRARKLLYQANNLNNNVLVFAVTADGNTAPLRTLNGITLPNTLVVDSVNDRLYVNTRVGIDERIDIFDNASTLSGTVAPNRSITNFGSFVRGLALDVPNNRLFVAIADNALSKIDVFDSISTKNGTAAATVDRIVTGPNTSLNHCHQIFLDPTQQRLYVTSFGNNSVQVFANAATMTGDVPPVQNLFGAATGLPAGARGLAVDLVRGELFVSKNPGVLIFSTTATGNTAPLRVITSNGGSWLEFYPDL